MSHHTNQTTIQIQLVGKKPLSESAKREHSFRREFWHVIPVTDFKIFEALSKEDQQQFYLTIEVSGFGYGQSTYSVHPIRLPLSDKVTFPTSTSCSSTTASTKSLSSNKMEKDVKKEEESWQNLKRKFEFQIQTLFQCTNAPTLPLKKIRPPVYLLGEEWKDVYREYGASHLENYNYNQEGVKKSIENQAQRIADRIPRDDWNNILMIMPKGICIYAFMSKPCPNGKKCWRRHISKQDHERQQSRTRQSFQTRQKVMAQLLAS
jgi:hypothetical protein